MTAAMTSAITNLLRTCLWCVLMSCFKHYKPRQNHPAVFRSKAFFFLQEFSGLFQEEMQEALLGFDAGAVSPTTPTAADDEIFDDED